MAVKALLLGLAKGTGQIGNCKKKCAQKSEEKIYIFIELDVQKALGLYFKFELIVNFNKRTKFEMLNK